MIERDGETVRAIAWSEVFPWLSILRVFRLAVAVRAVLLGAVGILIMETAWGIVGNVFGTDSSATEWLTPFAHCSWESATSGVPDKPTAAFWILYRDANDSELGLNDPTNPKEPMRSSWALLSLPAWAALGNANLTIADAAALLLCGLVGVAVWGFFGMAICRMAAVQLAADEQVGWGPALRYACRKWPACCAAPLLPIGGVVLAMIPVWVLGLIMQANVGLLLGGLLWPLVLVASLLITLLLLGVLFGWPLMWATIGVEGTDSFDALSRSYAYVFQRPLHYLFYIVVAGFIGWLSWLLVQNFAAAIIWIGYWAAGLGSGSPQIEAILSGEGLSGVAWLGSELIRFFAGFVKLLAIGFLFSYFWTATVAIYFLLRRDVDATELDEVYLDADASEPAAELPAVTTDKAGAPVVEEGTAKSAE